MVCFDARCTRHPLTSFTAHDETVSSLSFSAKIPGLLATGSIDKTVRIWDTLHVNEESNPKLIAYKSMNVGKLFALHFCTDEPYMLATAGDQGVLAVWESSEIEQIKSNFDGRLNQSNESYRSPDFVIGSNDDLAREAVVEDTSWMDSMETSDGRSEDKVKKKKKKSRKP